MSKLAKALTAAAGNAGGDPLYVEDVFSTYLYEGSNGARTIANGISLSDEGGLVWLKQRGAVDSHVLFDTVNGPQKSLASNDTAAGADYSSYLSFPSAGTAGWNLAGAVLNGTGTTWASWSFRKAEKFFDIVNGLTSDSSGNLPQFNHNLGSTPGCVIMKATDSGSNWVVFHKGLSASGANQYIQLNQSNAATNATGFGIATDTTFEVGAGSALVPSVTYVAYLFASDAGGFGDDGSENIIKCGSYTGNGSTDGPEIDLGFEPQFLIVKNADASVSSGTTCNWRMYDSMRGWEATGGEVARLFPNLSLAESSTSFEAVLTATGFKIVGSSGSINGNGENFIYIAIRRPMKTPESGTEVFTPIASTSTPPTTSFTVGFPADLLLQGFRTYGLSPRTNTRLTGGSAYLETANTASEATGFGGEWDLQDDYAQGSGISTGIISWFFKRATGFMDVVCYTGTGVLQEVQHNLGTPPELIINKSRSADANSGWPVYAAPMGNNKNTRLNTTDSFGTSGGWNSTTPTASVFYINGYNTASVTYVAYLFATLAGVSKVGSYTGTGADLNVDCGFTAGARFILIKRTDSTGDWYVWDSARGIIAGNDPYLLLNSTAAEVTNTDYIDPLSSGFTVTSSASSTVNVSSGTYIFLAIA